MGLWWILLLGAIASGPIWIIVSLRIGRRIWRRRARKLVSRARGHEHLVELGQLAGGLTHEIRNPLSTINVNLQLLAEDLARGDNEEHQRWLRRLNHVQDEADRLKSILDDFLQYAGKYELTFARVDIRRMVGELVDFFAPQAETAGVVIRFTQPEEAVSCDVDMNLMKQAVLNLMINAVQAMPDGGELLIHVAEQRGQAIIEVIDTGPGMDAEILRRIFDVYYSTKKHGTGLGLPTVRRVVREHGGTIRPESEVGKGTRFVISLPIAKKVG